VSPFWAMVGCCDTGVANDMTALPFVWDQGVRSPGQSRWRSRLALNMRNEAAGPDPHAVPSFHSCPERAGFRKPNILTRASK
jgi:hypothetical protein